ncbi:hypothetical protein N4297_15280, partial [Staphylococcus aureus]|nr:hypothetical protein [Staphylococcus aureus]
TTAGKTFSSIGAKLGSCSPDGITAGRAAILVAGRVESDKPPLIANALSSNFLFLVNMNMSLLILLSKIFIAQYELDV